MVLIISLALNKRNEVMSSFQSEKEIIILTQDDDFSEELLLGYLKYLKVKFPLIVLAQAIEESNHYRSDIYKDNCNLFGMKVAKTRPSTALGINRGHAYYYSWKESAVDYALWQAAFMRKVKTPKQYLEALEQANYAENPNYIKNVERIYNQLKIKYESN